MAKIFKFIILALIAGTSSAAVTIFYHAALRPGSTPSLDLSYADFLSITLTALGLMITVLGFFIAAASVIGWTTLESKLRDHSIDYFKAQLSKDGELRSELENLFTSIAYQGIDQYKSQDISEEKESEYHD